MKHYLILFCLLNLFPNYLMANKIDNGLNVIKHQLIKAQNSLKNKQKQKQELEKQILKIDSELSIYTEEIAKINLKIKQVQKNANQIKIQITKTENEINSLKTKIALFLNLQYKNQFPNAVVLMLQHHDPNDKLRNLEYLKYIQTKQKESFHILNNEEKHLQALKDAYNIQFNELFQLVKKNKKLLKRAQARKNEKLKLKQLVIDDIKQERKNIQSLLESEAQLNQLITRITENNKKYKKLNKNRQLKASKSDNIPHFSKKNHPEIKGNLTDEDFHLIEFQRAQIVDSSESLVNSSFSKYKGFLTLPVQGVITQSYGQKRTDGGIVKGFVIKSFADSPVFSVGEGSVVYVGTLADYGKTVVVLHDDVYVSVYTGLSKINILNGKKVNIKTILGRSGEYNGESGIYFELRENSRPINPKSWFKQLNY